MLTNGPPTAAIIGFGQQGRECFDAIAQHLDIIALVDPKFFFPADNTAYVDSAEKRHFRGEIYRDVNNLLEEAAFDLAFVCVPHAFHTEISCKLLRAGKSVIKEKPFAPNVDQADLLIEAHLVKGASLLTICQRSSSQIFDIAENQLPTVGSAYAFHYQYFLSRPNTDGWRTRRDLAHGGVLLDMGYHLVDITRRFFGVPDFVNCSRAYADSHMLSEGLEDYAAVQLIYPASGIVGTLLLGRHYHKKIEKLEIFGSKGVLEVEPMHGINISTIPIGQKMPALTPNPVDNLYKDNIISMLGNVRDKNFVKQDISAHYNNTRIIEMIYGAENRQVMNTPQSNGTAGTRL